MNRIICLLVICCLSLSNFTIHAEELNDFHRLTATSTCDLSPGAEITYGIPVRENKQYYLGLIKYKGTSTVLLIELDKPASKCPNDKNIDAGKILSNLSVNSQAVKGTQFINLECEKIGSNHHFIGVVAQRHFNKRFVSPEQAWEIDLRTHNFNVVESKQVKCFVGGYD